MADDHTTDTNSGAYPPPHEDPETMQASILVSEQPVQSGQQLEPVADESSSAGASHATGAAKQPGPAKRDRRRSVKNDAKKWCEEIISVYAKVLLLRAREVHKHSDVDWTSLWSPIDGKENQGRGFSVSDGFGSIWFVPAGGLASFPAPAPADTDELAERIAAFREVIASRSDLAFASKVKEILESELQNKCQGDLNENREMANQPATTWEEARSRFSTDELVALMAKRRLIDGRALLPNYYRANIVEVSNTGALFTRHVAVPGHVDVEGICLRLDAWSPANSQRTQESMRAFRRKLNVVCQHGTDAGKRQATHIQGEMGKSFCDPLGVGGHWYYKLRADETYSIRPGKGPGELRSWSSIRDAGSLNALKQGISVGKQVAFARQWTIRMRYLWMQLDQLKDCLVSANRGEPELTDDQLAIVDKLLAEQSKEEKEQGVRLGCLLTQLGEPTFRLEFAEIEEEE
ncbi:hypothetical protein B0T10DRAFT_606004 [Thelonectria olida]|uniref:Uncharacterized protein n=1 Tax=Thelonectria olida TaxID=1576542 RepID=A0A9P8W6H6_9HYPO|nr:hypothetical protein B0T10DRAFT_606004 [Thelonectria olida]